MKMGFIRIIAISIGTLMAILCVLVALHMLGMQTEFKAMDHPLLLSHNTKSLHEQRSRYKSVHLTYQIVDASLMEPKELVKFLDQASVIKQGEGKSFRMPKISVKYVNDEWVTFNPLSPSQTAPLEKFLKIFKTADLAIDVHASLLDPLKKLVANIKDLGFNENVIVFADRTKVLHRLRELSPRWLYVANESQRMRAKIMSSLLLETLADFEFDIVTVDANEKGYPNLPWRLLAEFHRRHKLVLLNRKSLNDQSISPHLGRVVEGYVFNP